MAFERDLGQSGRMASVDVTNGTSDSAVMVNGRTAYASSGTIISRHGAARGRGFQT